LSEACESNAIIMYMIAPDSRLSASAGSKYVNTTNHYLPLRQKASARFPGPRSKPSTGHPQKTRPGTTETV